MSVGGVPTLLVGIGCAVEISLSCNDTPIRSPIDLIMASAEHSSFAATPVISKQSRLRY